MYSGSITPCLPEGEPVPSTRQFACVAKLEGFCCNFNVSLAFLFLALVTAFRALDWPGHLTVGLVLDGVEKDTRLAGVCGGVLI